MHGILKVYSELQHQKLEYVEFIFFYIKMLHFVKPLEFLSTSRSWNSIRMRLQFSFLFFERATLRDFLWKKGLRA